jgi:hypothetical protein
VKAADTAHPDSSGTHRGAPNLMHRDARRSPNVALADAKRASPHSVSDWLCAARAPLAVEQMAAARVNAHAALVGPKDTIKSPRGSET